jgi:hypothetical protein
VINVKTEQKSRKAISEGALAFQYPPHQLATASTCQYWALIVTDVGYSLAYQILLVREQGA